MNQIKYFSAKNLYIVSALFAFTLSPVSVAAQSTTTPKATVNDTITVTGARPDKKQIRKDARVFVGKATTTQFGQYARRNDPLCPMVVGINQDYADIVISKIRTTAQAAGVPLASGKCRANLHVFFTGNGNALLAKIAKDRPGVLGNVPPSERSGLINSAVPLRWWYTTQLKGSDRTPAAARDINKDYTNFLSLKSYSSSVIDSKIIIDLTSAVVVVDVNQATGFPLESIAAFAAMVSFAEFKSGKPYGEFPSILAMFTSGGKALDSERDLTKWDYAYVNALYKVPASRTGDIQKSQISNKMATALTE